MQHPPRGSPNPWLLLGNQLILWILIVIYCSLTQSLFSTIALIFLVVSVVLKIAKPYRLKPQPAEKLAARQREVTSFPAERIIWTLFGCLNIGFLAVKVVIYFGFTEDMTQNLKNFLQVGSLTAVFVPLIIIPFSILAAFTPTQNISLLQFKKKLNPFLPLPLYLVLCMLIILIQIFSVSITGLIYFFINIYLFWMKSFNFKDRYFKFLLILVQVMTTVTLFLTFLTTCDYLETPQAINAYQFVGINSLNDFGSSSFARGHFICEVLLSLMTALLNRLFIYQSLNSIYQLHYVPNVDIKPLPQVSRGEGEQQRMRDDSPTKRSLRQRLIPQRVSEKVPQFKQQMEMRDFSQRESFHSDNHEDHLHQNVPQNGQKQQFFLQEVLNFQDEAVDETEQEKKARLRRQREEKYVDWIALRRSILSTISSIFHFLNSPQFSLRVIEVISIIVIQRYNNVYSFANLIWLAFVSSVQNLLWVRVFTAAVILPLEICNFIITYFYNIPHSPATVITNGQIFGFQYSDQIWLDVIIFTLYLNYIVLFVKSYRQILEANEKKVRRERRRPKTWQVVAAFCFRYTYMLTMVALFFLGFSKPTVINLIYVSLFLVFFSNGDKLIFIEKLYGRRKRSTLTTFSKHHWHIIVYYTLAIIIGKYLYFLFFEGKVSNWLQPTGLNETYNWSFNFSLTDYCPSNTTPFFIVFLLAEIQIIIYRSYVYTNYSFSIMADFVEGTARKSDNMKSRLKRKFIEFVVMANELYYQSIYYLSGFIIIGCSYRWSFIGLAIIALTCLGLLSSFSKKLLGTILALNLLFLFLNYLVLLINEYSAISDAIGQAFIDQINNISLFIGFSLAKDSYASLFVLNIVIFYFCVICYALSNILEARQFDQLQLSNSSEVSRSSVPQDHREFREPTVVDSQYEDDRFAETYRRDVIESTRRFYNQNLVRKYGWLRAFGNFLRMFLTDFVAVFVIIECLYFRLSVSMLLFLLVYLVYYFTLFDNIGSIYAASNFRNVVQEQLDRFSAKEKLLQQLDPLQSLISDQKHVQQAQKFVQFKAENIQVLKNDSRRQIWRYSAFLSVSCLILTYASQFLISEFYTSKISFAYTDTIQIVLFLLGVNSGFDFGNYVYFYYVMLIINIIEKLTIAFSEKMLHHEHQVAESDGSKDIKQLPKLENPQYLINGFVSQDFIVDREGGELIGAAEIQVGVMQPMGEEGGCLKQANLLIYFEYKMVLIRLNMLYGCIHFMIRFYLWLMLINLYSKGNIFAFAYLIAVLWFWFRDVNFGLIRNINKAAIIILLLQYFGLLLDVNTTTSPISLPTDQNLSLLEFLIDDPAWVNFLAVSSQDDNNNSYLASFLINSIIIFLTELCFTIYQQIAELIVRSILALYRKYESVLQKLQGEGGGEQQQIEVNLQAYKSWYHRMGVFFYENMIMNSYLIVSLLMFVLLSGVHNFLALFLLSIAFLYIYLGIFTALSEREDIFSYTRIFFRVFNVLQLAILLVDIILNMPLVPATQILNQFRALSSIQQIILILFIQVWIDLHASRSFKSLADEYRIQNRKKRAVFLRCSTFQKNNYLLSSLIRQFKEILAFDNNIAQAMQIIKGWHATTKRQVKTIDYDFGSIQEKDSTRRIRAQIEEQRIGDDHKSFAAVIKQICEAQTDVALSFNYYDILRFVTRHIGGLTAYRHLRLSAWRFIKEDYDVLESLLEDFDEQLRLAADSIAQNQADAISEVLAEVKTQLGWVGAQEEEKQQGPPKIIQENISAKLAIRPQNFHQLQKGKFHPIAFLLSNLEAFIVLLIQIYYCANPCLFSLPLIAFAFCYYLVASRKLTFLLLAYIFILIFIGQLVQILGVADTTDGAALLKFLYYIDTDGTVSYCLGYLYFLFVVIFLQQEVIRYRGSKFRDCEQVQNLEKAFLRVLINQQQKSKLYLWKYSDVEHEFLQNINPFNIAAYEVQNNLQRLFSSDASFFDVFSNRKIGADFYPPIAAVQIFLTIYLIFFYPLMTDVKGFTLQQATKYYQFSSDMVIGVLVHVASIVIERYITIQVISRRKKVIMKYIYTLIIFALFCWFVFYLAPYKASLTLSASFYSPSPALIAFSFFYFIYFYLSALQVKYGYKEFKSFNSLMTRRGYVNYYMVSAYTAIPFLYEVKIIMDWTFSATSLTLFDWFRQFSIYLSSFSSKINYYSATTTTVLGQTIPWYYKIMGWSGFILIILIIFGPMILFSGLNPIAQTNLVVSGSMQLSLQVKNGNSFTLYSTSHFSNPPLIYNESMFNAQGFNNVSVLQQMTSSDISQQFQSITYEPVSDSNWGITQPNYLQILQSVNKSINDMTANNTPSYQFQLVVNYIINRQITQTIATGTSFTYPSQATYLSLQQLQSLYKTMTTCNSPTYLPSFYIALIRLNTQGNTYKPRPIVYYNNSPTTGLPQQPYLFNVTLNLLCQIGATNVTNTNDVFWNLYLDLSNSPTPDNSSINATEGLTLYVYCDKYQNIIGGYGFTALYTSIILVVAGFIRTLVDGNLPLTPYQMNPKPDNILQICEAINTLRMRKQFREEYLMYYQLIDIIRSPEIMKHLSGSYPYLIEQAHEKSIREQQEKQLQKQKTL